MMITGTSAQTPTPKGLKVARVRSAVASTLLWTIAITSVAGAAYIVINKIHFARVLSGSMQPQFQRGDVLVLKPIDRSAVIRGQVLMLPTAQGDGSLFVHRVIEVDHTKGSTLVRTKGDANPVPDADTLRITSTEVPLVTGVINMSLAPMIAVGKAGIVFLFVLLLIAVGSLFYPRQRGSHRSD
jgi:signal peptidase I